MTFTFEYLSISTIYTAGDDTLAEAFDCQVHEVKFIKQAIFNQFQTLYDWQQSQIAWNKQNRGRIKTFLGDIRKTVEEASKQTRQSINADVQGTCSLIATAGFNNIITTASKKRMFLNPAVLVHDALVAYAQAQDIELLYEHYQENFYRYLDEKYQFRFPFDLEIATTYYDKIVLSKDKEGRPRHYNVSGTNKSVFQVLDRCIKAGKKIEFLNPDHSIELVFESMDNKHDVIRQYVLANGTGSYDRDFSYGSYDIRFVD